jgi:hypothetical protein
MKPSPSESSAPKPLASTTAEIRQLSRNTSATAAELKAFLAEFKGRSPQEMLGLVAASKLVRSLVISTVLVIIGILLFTAIPFFLRGDEAAAAEAAETPVAANKAPEPAPPEPAPAPESVPEVDLSKLGVTEEKEAPPDVNPLETKGDDFLDGLE